MAALIIKSTHEERDVSFGPVKGTRDHHPEDLFELILPSIYCNEAHPTVARLFVLANAHTYDHVTIESCEFSPDALETLLEYLEQVSYDSAGRELRFSIPAGLIEMLVRKVANESY